MANRIRAGVAAARVLRDRGVRYAFGVPGESFLGLLDALYETPEIRLVPTRHEGAAAFMADAVGKMTGQPAICMGTRGVGSANLAIGIHTAYQDSTPLIALVGQVETPFRYREALQEVELATFLGQITKWAVEAPRGEELPRLASEAYRRSTSGRPGPVAIALRGDILDDEVSADLPLPSAMAVSSPPLSSVREALALLRDARRPLVIAGGGVLRGGATADLVAFAEQTGVPVMAAFRRLDIFPNDHALSLGSLSFATPSAIVERARAADVVLAIGTRLAELTTLGYSIPSAGASLIHVDISPDETGRSFPARIAIAADARESLATFVAEAAGMAWPDRAAVNAVDRQEFEAATAAPEPPSATDLVDPAVVVAELQRQLPPQAILTCDAGNFFGWVARYYRFTRPGTFLGPTSGAMGYAVPAAVAAALVRANGVPVVALAGDGGFLMTANELAVAAQLGLRLTCVVFDNALYGTIRLHQERAYPGRVAGTELWSPDFVRLAEAFGGLGLRVERNADVPDALRRLLAHDGIGVLSVAVARDTISVGQSLGSVAPGPRRG
jgi:acetolactate synthase-1/2/3 large subunit